jgi:hypothetical protein
MKKNNSVPLFIFLRQNFSFSQSSINGQWKKAVDSLIATQFKPTDPGISVLTSR